MTHETDIALRIQRHDTTLFGATGSNGVLGTLREVVKQVEQVEKEIDVIQSEMAVAIKEVQLMTEAFKQFRNALVTTTGSIVVLAVGILLFQQGVFS